MTWGICLPVASAAYASYKKPPKDRVIQPAVIQRLIDDVHKAQVDAGCIRPPVKERLWGRGSRAFIVPQGLLVLRPDR